MHGASVPFRLHIPWVFSHGRAASKQARKEAAGAWNFPFFIFIFFWRQAAVASYIAHLRFVDPVTKVAGVAVLHDDAQAVLVEEGVGVTDDVGVAHASEEFHLVPAGLLLLGGDILQLDDLREDRRLSPQRKITGESLKEAGY